MTLGSMGERLTLGEEEEEGEPVGFKGEGVPLPLVEALPEWEGVSVPLGLKEGEWEEVPE